MSLLSGFNFNFPFWQRNRKGDSFYDVTEFDAWYTENSNLKLTLNHPLLSPAVLFIAKLYAQAMIQVVTERDGKPVTDSPFNRLLKKPNFSQTFADFLESLIVSRIANGVGVVWARPTWGTSKVSAMYVLDYALIEFPEEIKKISFSTVGSYNRIGNMKVVYDKHGRNLSIRLKELMFFYDMPNGLDIKNPFEASSRVNAIRQTLYNTKDSEIAKNIIIKSNGKEMITGEKDGFPLNPEEKDIVENKMNSQYGLSWKRRRTLVTKAAIKWQSMHIIMRDLGADESIRTDAAIIFTALHLPRDVYSIDGAKSTYKNANQSLVSYIQNDLLSMLKSDLETFNEGLLKDTGYALEGSYDHLPVMLSYKTVLYEGIQAQAKALNDLLKTGVPAEIALEMTGFDPNLNLGEREDLTGEANSAQAEEKVRELIAEVLGNEQ